MTHTWLGALFGDDLGAPLGAHRQLALMLRVERVFTEALKATRDAAEIDETLALLDGFTPDMEGLREGCGRDGVVVPALSRQLKAAVPERLRHYVHKGLTSQDVIDTALVLGLREVNDEADRRLGALHHALSALIGRFGGRSMMGATWLQDAVPITVADRLNTWRVPVGGARERLASLRPHLERLQFGGAAGTLDALPGEGPAVRARLADLLDLPEPERPWHAMRGAVVDYASWLSLVTGALGKMGADLALMAQQGSNLVTISGGGTSSAMAHKSNPVAAELLVAIARVNAGDVATMHQALVHPQERSGAAWMIEWMVLPGMVERTGRALTAAIDLAGRIERLGDRSG